MRISLLLFLLCVTGCSSHAETLKRDRYIQIGMDCTLQGVIDALRDGPMTRETINSNIDRCVRAELKEAGEE